MTGFVPLRRSVGDFQACHSRELANRNVDNAIARYLNEWAEKAALDLIAELKKTYGHIGRDPASGSSRYAHELNLPGLRS